MALCDPPVHAIKITLTTGDIEAQFVCSKGACGLCREFQSYARFEPWTYYDGPEKHSLHNGIITLHHAPDSVVWSYGAKFTTTQQEEG